MDKWIIAIIGIVIAVTVLTSLGGTVVTQTATNAFNSSGTNNPAGLLVNASSTGKTMYSLIELLYPIIGVVFMVTVGLAVKKKWG
jgi:hypothetical protein